VLVTRILDRLVLSGGVQLPAKSAHLITIAGDDSAREQLQEHGCVVHEMVIGTALQKLLPDAHENDELTVLMQRDSSQHDGNRIFLRPPISDIDRRATDTIKPCLHVSDLRANLGSGVLCLGRLPTWPAQGGSGSIIGSVSAC